MRRTAITIALVLVVCVAVFGLAGCYRKELPKGQRIHIGDNTSSASAVTDISSVPLGGAQTLDAKIRMGAGELALESGGADALEADFNYAPSSIKPEVGYEVNRAGAGVLSVVQPEFDLGQLGDMKNTWKLALASEVPLDLVVDLGAGKSDLALGGLDLRNLAMNMGAGETTLDFSGTWNHDVDAQLQAGIGQVTMRFPADVGVRVETHDSGIGEFVADSGFVHKGSAFENRAYGETTTTIEVSIQRGIGEVRLETVR